MKNPFGRHRLAPTRVVELDLVMEPPTRMGPLKLNMTRGEVRQTLSVPVDVPDWEPTRDFFASVGIDVHYDDSDRAQGIECFDPCRVCLKGIDLLSTPWGRLATLLEEEGYSWYIAETPGFVDIVDQRWRLTVEDSARPPVTVALWSQNYEPPAYELP